jgi:hypothetical protein
MGYAVETEKQYVNGNEVTSDGAYDTLVEVLAALQAFYPSENVLRMLDGALVAAHIQMGRRGQ